MDGTLADSIDHYYRVACEILELAGAPEVSRTRVCELMGNGDPELMRKLLPPDFPDVGETLARIVRERGPAWRAAAHHLPPIDGVVELLRGLELRGFQLGIATSSNRALPLPRRLGGSGALRIDRRPRGRADPETTTRRAYCGAWRSSTSTPGARHTSVTRRSIWRRAARQECSPVGVLTGTTGRTGLEAAGANRILGKVTEITLLLSQ